MQKLDFIVKKKIKPQTEYYPTEKKKISHTSKMKWEAQSSSTDYLLI